MKTHEIVEETPPRTPADPLKGYRSRTDESVRRKYPHWFKDREIERLEEAEGILNDLHD